CCMCKQLCVPSKEFQLFCSHAASNTNDEESVGSALYLTPLIESGQLEHARNLSRVGSLGQVEDVPGYSGFLTVDAELGSNLFFWFFPSKTEPRSAPFLLWLQGGPGSTSLFGLFSENGPYLVAEDGTPHLRDVTWVNKFSVLYLDNPVGAGFSFTESEEGYARNLNDTSKNLFEALQQFFTLFPEYIDNDVYVGGESYGGKYVPALAYTIDTAVQPRVKINLKGIYIGNGFIDPVSMMNFADYLYQIGLVDKSSATFIRQQTEIIVELIEDGRYLDALNVVDPLLAGIFTKPTYFKNVTGMDFYFNYLYSKRPKNYQYFDAFLESPTARKALHVGNRTFTDTSKVVQEYLKENYMASAKPYVEALIEKYKVMLYSGQLDISVAYPLTENFISTLQWSGAKALTTAPRQIWATPDGEDVAGYVKQVGNFTEVLIRNAGHMSPHDQPVVLLDMMVKFVDGKPFSGLI
ncbi:serine carboxypeptidase, putative, partial [Ixodes scapularis]